MKDNKKLKLKIIKLSEKVYNTLHEGYNESVYEEALAVEFRKNNIKYSVERNVEILYEGEKVGVDRLDFIVDDCLVVELKAASKLSKGNESQTTAYLKTTNLSEALLINFPVVFSDDGIEVKELSCE